MPKIDIPIKRLMQKRSEDWVRVILPDCEKGWIFPVDSEFKPKMKSNLDGIYKIDDRKREIYLHIEPQGYLDHALPARMLRYRSDIWEYTINNQEGTPRIKQVVIFFYPQHDNRNHKLEDKEIDDSRIEYSYDVIKVWKMKKADVIEKKLIGLYPLLPLMEIEQGETPDSIVELTVKTIHTVLDEATKNDLFGAMGVLASERFSKEIVYKHIRRERKKSTSDRL